MAKKQLTIVLILTLVFGQLLRIPLDFANLEEAFLTPTDIISFILVFLWILPRRQVIFRASLSLPILLFIGIAFLSLLVNSMFLAGEQLVASFLYLLRWSTFAGIYFVVREFDNKTKETFLYWLAGAGVLTVIFGIFQYFFYPDLRNLYYAGWDEHLYRIFGTFLDPNFTGAFFVLTFIVLLGLIFRSGKIGLLELFLVFCAALTIVATLLTYSRSAFLMFATGAIVLFLLLGKKRALLIVLALFILGISLLPKNLPSEGVKLTRTASISARQESVQRALTIFKDSPVFGVGFNAYRYAQKRFGFLTKQDWQTIHSGAGTDNSFLFVLATTGVIGLVAFLNLWYRILGMAFTLNQYVISKVVIASTAGIFVNSLFINSLFYESILVWMWIEIAIMERR